MKKLLVLLTGIFVFYYSNAQTYVTGGIYANTTWTTTGSPYILSDTVVVFSSVKLTIQPGVVVKFNTNALLEILGRLEAKGTAADSIIFTSNSAIPYAGIYNGIESEPVSDTISLRYCRFSYANTAFLSYQGNHTPPVSHCYFISDLTGSLSYGFGAYFDTCTFEYDSAGISPSVDSGEINGCVFKYNSSGIYQTTDIGFNVVNCIFSHNKNGIAGLDPGTITHCIIDSNEYNGVSGLNGSITYSTIRYNGKGISFPGRGYMAYNDISYNGIGISCENNDTIESNNISNNTIGIETINDIIHCNTICNNTQYSIVAEMPNNELASHNYWCTTDSAQIQATIYDAYQNINYGFIFFTPIDTLACSNVPTSINELPVTIEITSLYPNPNNGIFTIQSSVNSGQSSLEIYNVLGEKVYSNYQITKSSNYQINLSSQPNGIYLYRVIKQGGSLVGEGKLIIQK